MRFLRRYTSYLLSLFSIVFVSLVFFNNQSYALTQQEQQNFVQNLDASGITFNQTGSNLDIIIDQVKALNTIPKLQSLGYLSNKINQEIINQKPTEITFMIGTVFTTVIIPFIYETNDSADHLHVTGFLVSPSDGKQPCFTLDFDRALYTKTDWKSFTGSDLMKTAPNYTIVDWCHTKITDEIKANK